MLISVLRETVSLTRFKLAFSCLFHVPAAIVEIASPKRKAGTVINETVIPPEALSQGDTGDLSRIQVIKRTAKIPRAISSTKK